MDVRRPYDIDSITDVAFSVFAQRGYDATSMDDVAEAAGITKASIYHHISGKEALLSRGLERALGALFAILEEPRAREGDAAHRLRVIVRRTAEVTMQLLPEVSVLFRVRGNSRTEVKALERRRKFDAVVSRLVAQAQGAHQLRGDIDPSLVTRLVFGLSNSVVEWYKPNGRMPAAEIADAVEALVFGGLTQGG